MDEDQKKKMLTIGLIAAAVIGIGALAFSIVNNSPVQQENIVGTLDGTGPGSTQGQGLKDKPAEPGGETRPANVEGGRGQ